MLEGASSQFRRRGHEQQYIAKRVYVQDRCSSRNPLCRRCCKGLNWSWHRRVEKRDAHRKHQISALRNERDMRRARYDGELGFRQAGQITWHATAEQPEKL